PLELDPARAHACLDGAPVSLTATELRLLQLLLESPGQVFSRPRIYEAVWQGPFVGGDDAVKTHVANLRAKLRGGGPALEPIEPGRPAGRAASRTPDLPRPAPHTFPTSAP